MTNISFNPYESILSNNNQNQNDEPFNANIECNNSKWGPLFSENSFDLEILKSHRNSINPNDKKQRLRGSDKELKDLREKDSNIIYNSNLEVKILDENSNLEEEKILNPLRKKKKSNILNNMNNGHIQEVNEEDEEDKKSNINIASENGNNNSKIISKDDEENNKIKLKASYNNGNVNHLPKIESKDVNLTILNSKKSTLDSFFKTDNKIIGTFNVFYSEDNFSFSTEGNKNNNEKENKEKQFNNKYENNFENNNNNNKKENNENKFQNKFKFLIINL